MVSSFRRWLRRHPQPTRLRVDGRDVSVATGANQWAVTEESVMTLSPSRVEALDDKGVVLRATSFEKEDRDDDDDDDAKQAPVTELTTMARLLAEAHDAGARRHAEAYALAFAENTKLVQILATRLSGLETAWQKAMQRTAEAQAEAMYVQAEQQAHANEDPAGSAIASMLAAGLMHKNGAANGVADAAKAAAAQAVANGAVKNGAPKKKG